MGDFFFVSFFFSELCIFVSVTVTLKVKISELTVFVVVVSAGTKWSLESSEIDDMIRTEYHMQCNFHN